MGSGRVHVHELRDACAGRIPVYGHVVEAADASRRIDHIQHDIQARRRHGLHQVAHAGDGVQAPGRHRAHEVGGQGVQLVGPGQQGQAGGADRRVDAQQAPALLRVRSVPGRQRGRPQPVGGLGGGDGLGGGGQQHPPGQGRRPIGRQIHAAGAQRLVQQRHRAHGVGRGHARPPAGRVGVVGVVVGGRHPAGVGQQPAGGRHQVRLALAGHAASAEGGHGTRVVDTAGRQHEGQAGGVAGAGGIVALVAHGRHHRHALVHQAAQGQAGARLAVPVDRHQHAAHAVGLAVLQHPGAGGEEVARPGMPGLVEVVELDDGQAQGRGHAGVGRVQVAAARGHRRQGRAVPVVVPGSLGQGEVVGDVGPAHDLVARVEGPAGVGRVPVAGVPHRGRRSVRVVVVPVPQVAVGRVAARVEDGHGA